MLAEPLGPVFRLIKGLMGVIPGAILIEGIALVVIQTTLRANASRTAAQTASREVE